MKRFYFFLLILCSGMFVRSEDVAWSNLYKKVFTVGDKKRLFHKKECIFYHSSALFTQLLFSWNAKRPKRGYFRFYVAARDANTKKWYPWHTMIDWGRGVQKSYLNPKKGSTGYYHVRLEIPIGHSADAFKISVRPFNGATLSDLDGLFINTIHKKRFKAEHSRNFSKFASAKLTGVPKRSQRILKHPRAKAMCSPTSLSMLTEFLGKKPQDPLEVARKVYDKGLDAYGSWPFNTAYAFELCDGSHRFFIQRLNSFRDLHILLQKGIPVIVSVRGSLKGAQKPYKNGHLILVVGWNKEKRHLICHDPAFYSDHETLSHYHINDFLPAWEKSRRLSYVGEQL